MLHVQSGLLLETIFHFILVMEKKQIMLKNLL